MPLPMDAISALTPGAISLLERHGMLEQLVTREIMAAAAEGELVPADQEAKIRGSLCQRFRVEKPEQLDQVMAAKGIDPALAMWQASLNIRLQSYAQKRFGTKAEAHFLQRKGQLDRVVYSLLRVQDGDLAQELYLRIAEGEASFAELAEQFSQGPEQKTKGLIGPVALTQAHPVLAEILRTSKPGELRSPVRLESWFLVVRLESYQPASLDESTESQMAQELFQEWAQKEAALRIQVLKASAQEQQSRP